MIKKYFKLGKFLFNYNRLFFFLFAFGCLISILLESLTVISLYPVGLSLIDQNFLNKFTFLNHLNFTLKQYLLIFLSLIIFKAIYLNIFSYFKNKYIYSFASNISQNLYKNYINRSLKDVLSINSSEIIRNLYNEVNQFTAGLNVFFVILIETLISLSLIILLAFSDFLATTFLFGSVGVICFIYLLLVVPTIIKLSKHQINITEKIIRSIQETFDLFKIIKITKKEQLFEKNYKKSLDFFNSVRAKSMFLYEIIKNISDIFLIIILFIPFSYFVFIKNFSFLEAIPILSIFVFASTKIFPSIIRISTSLQTFNASYVSIELIMKEMNFEISQSNFKNDHNNKKFTIESDIQIKDLNFNYDREKKIFSNLDLVIKKNQLNYVFGSSGTGKTTLINIISCLIKPISGSMIVNNVDIFNSDLLIKDKWMSSIGYISQDSVLASASILENITLFEKNYDKVRLDEAIKLANLNDFINSLDDGIFHQVGESGDKISGGQKQRINIARALYHSPSILICDEITSSLDNKNKHEIISEIKKLKKYLTIILISHDDDLRNHSDNMIDLN